VVAAPCGLLCHRNLSDLHLQPTYDAWDLGRECTFSYLIYVNMYDYLFKCSVASAVQQQYYSQNLLLETWVGYENALLYVAAVCQHFS